MQSDWQGCTLGAFVRLQRGHDLTASEQKPGSVPVMGSAGPNGTHSVARAKGPGVVIGRSGASIGRVHFSAVDYWPHNTCLYVTDFLGNNPRFAYYLLQTLDLAGYNSGSAQPSLNRNYIYGMKLRVPSRDVQNAIVEVLQVLDDRIDLLRQTNATLESIAKALFKSWFIDFDPVRAKAEGREPVGIDAATAAMFPAEFEESALGLIPKGWAVERLGGILELAYGKALKATDRRPGCVPVYGSGGITGYHDEALVGERSVIVGRKGTVGALYWEDRPFFPIDTTFYVKPKTAPLTFCFYAMKRLGLEHMNTDAAVPGLNRENAYRRDIVRPTGNLLNSFDELIGTLRCRIQANFMRAETLSELRDALLPRLIFGKLRLPEAQTQLEDALA